jgi:hypothetical protein
MSVVMLGRANEIRLVEKTVDSVRAGITDVLVIRGEAGIGKTALLGHALAVSDGVEVHSARAVESEHAVSLALLSMVVRPLMSNVEALPAIQQRRLRAALGFDEPAAGDVLLLGAAVLGLLTEAARDRPQLLLLDDVHWADEVSLRALLFALRRLGHDRVGAILAQRDLDVPVLAGSGYAVVRPSRLDHAAVAALVAQATRTEDPSRTGP